MECRRSELQKIDQICGLMTRSKMAFVMSQRSESVEQQRAFDSHNRSNVPIYDVRAFTLGAYMAASAFFSRSCSSSREEGSLL